jgi:hypothetical protein
VASTATTDAARVADARDIAATDLDLDAGTSERATSEETMQVRIAAPSVDEPPTRARREPGDTVAITFTTDPPRARVRLDRVLRGETPLVLSVPRAESAIGVSFERSRYRTWHGTVVPDTPQNVAVTLDRVRVRGSSTSAEVSAAMRGAPNDMGSVESEPRQVMRLAPRGAHHVD